MDENPKGCITIGMSACLNTVPLYEQWRGCLLPGNWRLLVDTPAALDAGLATGRIDIGFLSPVAYALHPERYRILSGLSVTACGPVGVTYLFSHVPLDQLHQQPVLVSAESPAALALLRIVLEELHGLRPQYQPGMVRGEDRRNFQAVLAAGDDALRFVEEAAYLYQYDLGDIWRRETALPLVLAVCVVREELCAVSEEAVVAIHRELLRCRDEGRADLETVCALSAGRIPMSKKRCHDYLSTLQYDLGANKRKALETFLQFLLKRGECDSAALPMKVFANLY